jgi:tRNA A37 threonylcarbamoyladenosine biosynthesis protein TsaE
VLHHRYQGRLPIEHYDLFRLEGMAWVDTGLDEPSGDAVTVIEWPERASVLEAWASTAIRLTTGGEKERELTLLRGPDRIRQVFDDAHRD